MRKPAYLRLGVNIDHVATIRNARGGRHPDPVRAAHLAVEAGADGITAHLREDRRHISDDDIARLKGELTRPLNLEMAATDEMLAIALRHLPHACCLVPERREERTTEGGLDVAGGESRLAARRRRAARTPASASRCSSSPTPRRSRPPPRSAPTSSNCTPAPIASARSRTMPPASPARSSASTTAARLAACRRPRGARRPRPDLRHGRAPSRACRRSSSSTSATS